MGVRLDDMTLQNTLDPVRFRDQMILTFSPHRFLVLHTSLVGVLTI